MRHIFKLTGTLEGQSMVILDKYVFVDGVMVVDHDELAAAYEKILVPYYGCTHEVEPVAPAEVIVDPTASLSKEVTKGEGAPAAPIKEGEAKTPTPDVKK